MRARVLHPGAGSGLTCAIAPVSVWYGVGADGDIVDVHHPAHGTALVGSAVALETSKGSSSGSSVLAELITTHRAPALIVVSEPDAVLVSGCLAAAEISRIRLPVVQVRRSDLDRLSEVRAQRADCAGSQIGGITTVEGSRDC